MSSSRKLAPIPAVDVATNSNFPREITETALAHVIGDKAEQAYRRSDALEKRRMLMDAWSAYCEPKTSANVVQMRKQKSTLLPRFIASAAIRFT